MSKGRHRKAYDSLCRFRNSHVQAAKELYYVHAQMQEEELLVAASGVATNANIFTRCLELFTIPRVRRATQASGIVMIAQQMCGSKPPNLFISFVQSDFQSQHHRILLIDRISTSRSICDRCSSCVLGLRNHQLHLRLPCHLDYRHLRPPYLTPVHVPQHVLDSSGSRSLLPRKWLKNIKIYSTNTY